MYTVAARATFWQRGKERLRQWAIIMAARARFLALEYQCTPYGHPILHTQSPCYHLLSEWQALSCAGHNSASAARTTASYAITIVQDCSETAGKYVGRIHCFVECVCTSDTCSCMTASTCPFECTERIHAATCRTCAASCS